MKRIFVVEDDETILKLVTLTLQRAGYDVTGFRTGDEAFLRLHEAPAVLISDVHMPGISGLELAASAKIISPGTRVLLCSAVLDERAIAARESNIADCVMAKPWRGDEFLGEVASLAK